MEMFLHQQATGSSFGRITGERFDQSVRRFKIALEAAKLSGITNQHQARFTANRITKETTGVNLLKFVRPGYVKSGDESSQKLGCSLLNKNHEENDKSLIKFVNLWWEKYGDNAVDSSHLFQMITEADIPLNLGKTSEKSRKIKLGKLLSKLNGQHFGSYVITDAGKHRNIRLWKLKPIEKLTIQS